MLRIALAFVLGLTISSANAQETDTKYFMTRQDCDPALKMMEVVTKYGEEPLFTGMGMQFSYQGQPYTGGVMFFVNQDTGTWSLLTLYADGTACMTAIGTNFAPFVRGEIAKTD